MDDMEVNFYKDKSILVTGGAGSIGSEIVKKLLEFDPKVVRILDINETGLFDLEQELPVGKLRFLIGDVRDRNRLKKAVKDIDIIFHTSALKHVPLCEYNPSDAILTNVLGTQNVIDVALEENVKKFIMISTDKAVNPISVMGATKLLAERLTITSYFVSRETALSCVRFGNVIGSRGSVVPLFYNQIKKNKEITLTNKNMARFCMSISKAVDLVLKVAEMSEGGEIFVLKMPIVNIGDLALAMIELFDKDTKIKIVGDRLNEKMHEELITTEEIPNTYENEEMYVILPQYKKLLEKDESYVTPSYISKFKKTERVKREMLSKKEVNDMLQIWKKGKNNDKH